MTNGCPECDELIYMAHLDGKLPPELCLDCQLEQAEATVLQAMNEVERIKQKIKEKKNE